MLVWNPFCVYLDSIKTTIDIPEIELEDAMRFTGAKTKRDAVVRAMQEFNRRHRMAALLKFSGTFTETFPTNDMIEAVDLARDELLNGNADR